MKTAVKWVALGAGVSCASILGRAVVSNAAAVAAAVLSDFEARRTELPLSPVGVHKTSRATSTKLPPRLKADIEYARSAPAARTISLVESPAPISR